MGKMISDKQLGTHWLVDFSQCRSVPSEPEHLQQIMEEAARLCNATIVCSTFHRFDPVGLSGVVVIGESHLAVHTWPEHQAVCVDLFTCSPQMNAEPGIEYLKKMFDSGRVSNRMLARGTVRETAPLQPSAPEKTPL